jgi:surfactin synthase thioesterase subunit
MEKVKIFCLPYAGGSASIYFDWKRKYASVAEIIPIEYKGHGSLFGETFYKDADEAADDICNRICNESPQNYILYGHSMGSMIALLVAIKLEKKGYNPLPKAIIAGGTRPPHLQHKDEQLAHLPKDKFMKKMFDLGQTDSEVMKEPELVDMLYDVFYADLKLSEEYEHAESLPGASIPMVIMTGSKDDEAPLEDMKEWAKYTSNSFYIKEFDADHFFPFNCKEFDEYYLEMIDKAVKLLL